MRDPNSGAEAFIIPYDSNIPYAEYAVPQSPAYSPGPGRNRCIEALTRERCWIRVKLPAEFDFKGASAVQVECCIYAGDCVRLRLRGAWIRCSKIFERERSRKAPYLFDVAHFVATGDHFLGHRLFGLRFGRAGIATGTRSARTENSNLSGQGRIVIKIPYGERMRKKRAPELTYLLRTAAPGITTKRISVDYGRSHALDPIDLGAANDPESVHTFREDCSLEELIRFTFTYVSREYLERLNIIPKQSPAAALRQEHALRSPKLKLSYGFRTGQKRSIAEACGSEPDNVDDEEPLPKQRIKVETPVEDMGEPTPTPAPAPAPTVAEAATATLYNNIPANTPQTGAESNTTRRPVALNETASGTAQSEKARKRARLLLQLEEIAIKKQLLDLEDE